MSAESGQQSNASGHNEPSLERDVTNPAAQDLSQIDEEEKDNNEEDSEEGPQVPEQKAEELRTIALGKRLH